MNGTSEIFFAFSAMTVLSLYFFFVATKCVAEFNRSQCDFIWMKIVFGISDRLTLKLTKICDTMCILIF